MENRIPLPASGGDIIGSASISSTGSARIGFEIIYVPGGLIGFRTRDAVIGRKVFERIKDILSAVSLTRRLDPISFYASVISSRGQTRIAPEHSHSVLLRSLTRRMLIEIRDEYDLPFDGQVTVQAGNSPPLTQNPPDGSRGSSCI